ncbi:MAG: tail fiber domain-containing protein [Bacteroidota bacterium]
MGTEAGKKITDGIGNVLIGYHAGYNVQNSNSFENTFVSLEAGLFTGTTGSGGFHNCFFGDNAGFKNDVGSENTFIGAHCGDQNVSGNQNVFFGVFAGHLNATNYNTYIGYQSGGISTTGFNNVFLGYQSGLANTTGQHNTMIGTNADVGANNLINASSIGAHAVVNNNDQMILGGDFTLSSIHHSTFVGIGLSGTLNGGIGPQNSLEINADPLRSSNTATGLRFTQVKKSSSNNTFGNPYNQTRITAWGKVLTVDIDGNVGLTDDVGAAGAYNGTSIDLLSNRVQLGHTYLTGAGADLVNDREIPLANHDIYFTEPIAPGGVKNNIGMGIITNPRTRLCVDKKTLPGLQMAVAGQFSAETNSGNPLDDAYGIWCTTNNLAHGACNQLIGGKFSGDGDTKAGTYGLFGSGKRPNSAAPVWGGYFEAVSAAGIPAPGFAYGVEGFTKAPNMGIINYAVFGDLGIGPCAPIPCLPGTAPDFAGYFNGDVFCSTGNYLASDLNLKDNIQNIVNPLDIINQLNPKSYTFKREQNISMQLEDGTHFGLLAQDVENILPQLVKSCVHPPRYDSLGNVIYDAIDFKALNYTEFIPFLIAGMKEQQQIIEGLQTQIDILNGGGQRNRNPGDGEEEEGSVNSIDVELKNSKTIILDQNNPNPFHDQTKISFFISDDIKSAQILFYDNNGTVLRTVVINEKGKGELNVYAPDLSSGIYTYTLIADGKVIETKKMVKQ